MANKESKNFATKQAILRPCSHSYTSKLYWLMRELADQVWEAWERREISTYWAAWMWWSIVRKTVVKENQS